MKDIMIDLETLGKRPGCAILSIGAVAFGPEGLGSTFYTVINNFSCFDVGLHTDEDTIAWWSRQSETARKVIDEACDPNATPLGDALESFSTWCKSIANSNVLRPWGNGSDFDLSILQAAAIAAEKSLPWRFWNHRCFRTLKNLNHGTAAPEREGTHHNALDDAIHQAKHAVEILNVKSLW